MTELKNLTDLLVHELQLLHNTEKYQLMALPRMIENTNSPELKRALEVHLDETKNHQQRLDQIAALMKVDVSDEGSPAIKGLVFEGEKLLHKDATPETLDAAILSGVQKVEHYEISGYGTAAYLSEQLGLHEVNEILVQSLDEEKMTDMKLNDLAKSVINVRARQSI